MIGNAKLIATQDVKTRHVLMGLQSWQQVLVNKDGILHKTESKYDGDPWTITSVHTNGTIRVQCGTKSEHLNIRIVIPYFG